MLKEKAIVVGGGVIGLTTAYYLHNAGFQVHIFDQSEMGTEASWAGGGILSPLAPWDYPDVINDLVQESLKEYPIFIEEISHKTGMDVEYLDSGMLVIANACETSAAKKWSERYQQQMKILDSTAALQQVESAVDRQFYHAFHLPEVKQIRNPRLIATLKQHLQDCGVVFHNHEPVNKILHASCTISGVETQKRKYHAEAVIICAGAWTQKFVELEQTMIEPVLGQMLLYKTKPGTLKTIILYEQKYLIPRKDGLVLSGSSLEFNGFAKQPEASFHRQQQAMSEELLPVLKGAEIVKKWCGLRPGAPSGIPYIDEHQEVSGLYINAGHYRYGLTMAHASAKILLQRMNIEVARPTSLDGKKYAMLAERPMVDEFANRKQANKKG